MDSAPISSSDHTATLELSHPADATQPWSSVRATASREARPAVARAVLPIYAPLSPREHEVLVLLTAGLTDRAIALLLGISPRTVTTHVGNIYNKLGTNSRVVAATFAVYFGLADCALAPEWAHPARHRT